MLQKSWNNPKVLILEISNRLKMGLWLKHIDKILFHRDKKLKKVLWFFHRNNQKNKKTMTFHRDTFLGSDDENFRQFGKI